MIAYVKGQLKIIQEESIIVEANGLGYEIVCPNPFRYQHELNDEILIQTYFHVREDAQILYGFIDSDQKYLFTKLISVSGIGPKSAITILASVLVDEFIRAVESEDEKYLTQFPGVGKKTARQIILDLKGKLTQLVRFEKENKNEKSGLQVNHASLSETVEALKALGYSSTEIQKVKPKLTEADIRDTNALVKFALSLLMKS